MMKLKKHYRTLICLLVGTLVLTTAVYANYDSASGYTNYKNAVKKLAFTGDNFTGDMNMTFSSDGKNIIETQSNIKQEGTNNSYYLKKSVPGFPDSNEEYYNYHQGAMGYVYYPEENGYSATQASQSAPTFLDEKDPTTKKAIRFTELLADTFVGDLKNNFVLLSDKDGLKEYSVNIAGNQVPELVNAGLSLMFTSYNTSETEDSSIGSIAFEDYMASFKVYSQKNYNTTFEDISSKEQEDLYNNADQNFYLFYQKILDDKGNIGVVYVKADGSYDYYKDMETYKESNPVNTNNISSDFMSLLGNDPYVDHVNCTITIDKAGNLVANSYDASLVGIDKDGKNHEVNMKINLSLSDFGTTKADQFDPQGKIKLN